MPKVSVCIPTYNRSRLLSYAIASVLEQTFEDFELIVCDDGSHDSTPEGLEKQTRIVIDEVEQFAYMLELMKNVDQGERNLLENSLVWFANEHEHGEKHYFGNVPVVIAGNAGGKRTTGRHLHFIQKKKYADALISMLQILGLEIETLGPVGNGTIPELMT